MSKTYLELINNVLSRLREPAVGSVTANTYTTLIGQYVNDAKEVVEDSWSWSVLETPVSFSLVAGTYLSLIHISEPTRH